ncbi:FkbM family methyltransferase [Nodularia sp. NIES-3585]|uniref:FkbM family methyltransferase n=1 Tax=Nodularia sp. NIES-3585 TaxID=1973477 RepID=UPI000B5C67C1|nr:FkbM family methyltransferase [Nodularia sp. NIES-3585]GAX37561.1 methyltransferase FkbM family protein [Nodularia sp. NIES-3585]
MKRQKIAHFFWLSVQKIGILSATFYKLQFLFYTAISNLGIDLKGKKFSLYIKGIKCPIYWRCGTSDNFVFDQIFINEEYSGISNIENVNWIVDCGANVGYSAIYLLNKYPQARVIAIEPDSHNFELCSINLAPYGNRACVIKSAIWSEKTGLVLERLSEDNGEWGIQVRPCKVGETPDLDATSIKSIFEDFDIDIVDILKIDIETAEWQVFSRNYQEWLNKVRYIAIELHTQECRKVFFKALSSLKYDSWNSEELTFCKIDSSSVSISN